MHLRDLKGHIEGFIYRPQKLQSIPVNDTNGCHTYLKSEVKVENHEPHSFKDKPSCSVDKPLDSKISLNESQCSFEENLYSHSFDEVPITSEDNPLHSEMSVDASQETWDPDFFKEKSATFLESPIKSEMSLITSQLTFEESLDSHSFEEEPITSVDNQRNSEMSLTASQFLFEDSMVPVSHPLNNSYKRQKDPLAISPVKGRPDNSHHPTDQLLARAAEALRMRLKPNWICLLEGKGIHSMQLSRNFEKCTQRRIFFNTCGDVHLSVHCVPIPITNFVPCLKMVKLCNEHDISAFVDGMESIVDIIRQLEICTGVYHDKYKSLWQSSKRGEIDKNPYQEARYSLTLRSLQCCRLVRPRRRMCHSCSRLLDTLRLKARSRAKKLKAHSIP